MIDKQASDPSAGTTPYAYSLFQQPWWLDAVAPGQWSEITVVNGGGEVVARMPLVVKKKLGLTAITMPLLTSRLGPWLRPSNAKYARQLGEQKDLMQALIAQLPSFDSFSQNFDPEITNWLPFYWAGFEQMTYYTYRIDDLSDPDRVFKEFRENIRTDIRKAQKVVAVRDDLGIERFIEMNARTFARQGMDLPYSPSFVQRVDKACEEHGCRIVLFAEDATGAIHAAIYIAWDDNTCYYLMGGGDPALRNSGATSLLMWEAIKHSASIGRRFDFEGSMMEPVERFCRAFGARQIPYLRVHKAGRKMRLINGFRGIASALGRR